MVGRGFDTELVLAAAQVLDERVTFDDHRRGAVGPQAARRPQPRFQPAVIALDPVARILVLLDMDFLLYEVSVQRGDAQPSAEGVPVLRRDE